MILHDVPVYCPHPHKKKERQKEKRENSIFVKSIKKELIPFNRLTQKY